MKKELSPIQREELLTTLKTRFEKNMNRHTGLEWAKVQARLEANTEKLWSLHAMESTGGEPDVVGHDKKTGEQYRALQELGNFDTKTSSWIKTPAEIRKLGGAIFADFRCGHIFVYHNGAESYYGGRAFRGSLRV